MKIRKATGDDVPRIADIHVRSWQAAYRGILPRSLLDGLSVSEHEQSWSALLGNGNNRWLTLVAEDSDGRVTGFCSVAIADRDEAICERTAEIGALPKPLTRLAQIGELGLGVRVSMTTRWPRASSTPSRPS